MIRLRILWLRWRRDATDAEILARTRDGSLSDSQAVNYLRVRNFYAAQLAALEGRHV